MDTCPILEEKYDKTEEKGCQWERRELATGPRGPSRSYTAETNYEQARISFT